MIISLIVAGVVFGIIARIFIASIHFVSQRLNRHITFMPFRPMVGNSHHVDDAHGRSANL